MTRFSTALMVMVMVASFLDLSSVAVTPLSSHGAVDSLAGRRFLTVRWRGGNLQWKASRRIDMIRLRGGYTEEEEEPETKTGALSSKHVARPVETDSNAGELFSSIHSASVAEEQPQEVRIPQTTTQVSSQEPRPVEERVVGAPQPTPLQQMSEVDVSQSAKKEETSFSPRPLDRVGAPLPSPESIDYGTEGVTLAERPSSASLAPSVREKSTAPFEHKESLPSAQYQNLSPTHEAGATVESVVEPIVEPAAKAGTDTTDAATPILPPSLPHFATESENGGTKPISQRQILHRAAQRASKTWKLYTGRSSNEQSTPTTSLDESWEDSSLFHYSDNFKSHILGVPQSVLSMLKKLPIGLLMTLLVHNPDHGGGPTLMGMYAGALLGASCGFYLFLYFISLGYAAGIGIPLAIALTHFVKTTNSQPADFLPIGGGAWSKTQRTIVHTSLVILWSIRMFVFLVWREYWNWPALHKRIVQVNRSPPTQEQQEDLGYIDSDSAMSMESLDLQDEPSNSNTTLPTRDEEENQEVAPPTQQVRPGVLVNVLCWIIYSFFYLCLSSPCFFRMRHELGSVPASTTQAGDVAQGAENMALALQFMGLLLETVADWQKSTFKAQLNCRYEWCGIVPGLSLWKWSTHPNYLGEGMFWFGTYLAGMVSLVVQYFSTEGIFAPDLIWQAALMTVGFGFISKVLQGAIDSLDEKQDEKYGNLPEFAAFKRSHGLLGRKWGQPASVSAHATAAPLGVNQTRPMDNSAEGSSGVGNDS